MKTLQYGKYKQMFPESMAELTQSQLIDLARCFTGNMNLMDAKVSLAYHWAPKVFAFNETRIKDTIARIGRTDRSSQKEMLMEVLQDCENNRVHLAELCDWITSEQSCDKWIINRLELPRLLFWQTEFAGPSLRFGNMQFWEWCRAEQYFSQYIQTGDRDAFNKFCACIYHPVKNGVRQPFEDNLVSDNFNVFGKLSPVQVYAIRLNYIAVKNWIRSVHKELFVKREESDTNHDHEDMGDLLLRHADIQKVHYQIVAKDPLLVALKQMNLRAKDAREAKERQEETK